MSRSIPIALLMLLLTSANAAGYKEPSASKEPSADKEPSASKEPSADKELSAYKEPTFALSSSAAAARVCSGCHGASDQLPRLSGYSARQITAQMLAFKSGAREATLMGRLALGYSDGEIEEIAGVLGSHD